MDIEDITVFKRSAADNGTELFFRFRREDHDHPLALQLGHLLHLTPLFEVGGKTQQQDFSLILENDLAAAEKDISFHLIPVLEEILGMLQLEIEIVVIGIGAETNLLDHNLHSFGFQLLGFFLLLVKELRIVDDPANGGIGLR